MTETVPDFSTWPMDERVAARLGIPADTPPGLVELYLALGNPDGYAEIIRSVDDTALWTSFALMDRVHRATAAGVPFIAVSGRQNVLDEVAALRESCRLEAARRGLSLEAWPNLSPAAEQ
jgi:hypothetical protein